MSLVLRLRNYEVAKEEIDQENNYPMESHF